MRRPDRHLAALLVLAFALASQGCIVTETVGPARPDARLVRRVLLGAYDVWSAGRIVGRVQEFGRPDDALDHYYSVQNAWHQEVGMVDDLGRYWRHVPHADVPEHVGAGALAAGVQRLLDLPAEPELVPVDGPD